MKILVSALITGPAVALIGVSLGLDTGDIIMMAIGTWLLVTHSG